MATKNSSIALSFDDPPADPTQLQRYLREQNVKVVAAIMALADGHLDKQFVAPAKPRDGDIRYADGTLWNPGSGAGVYVFKSTVWVLLG